MTPSDVKDKRQQLEQVIAAQESLRGQVDDAIIEATIATLREKLDTLDKPLEQQRKQATILFVDIVDHIALTRGMDPEDQMALVDPLVARLANRVAELGGHVARYQGDGFKAVFGLPVARENDPEQAVFAGLAIQAEADLIAAELEHEQDLSEFKVRVGITTGQVFAGGDTEGEDTIKGPPVNLAARLESAAEPGTVLISHDTYQHVRGIFDLEPLDYLQVKGFDEPVLVYQVLEARPRAFYRGMRLVEGVATRMIGRESEFETLRDAYHTMVENEQLQFVTVIGEAGLGKSRLLYEFENWVELQSKEVTFFRGRAHFESQRLPYDLLRSIFAFRFNIRDDDPLTGVQEKWLAGFAEIQDKSMKNLKAKPGREAEMRAHILGQLLGYNFAGSPSVKPLLDNPQQLHDLALIYLEDYFKTTAGRNPILLLLDDLHWADDSSLDALGRLGLSLRDTPILIIGAARPKLYRRRPYWFEGRDFHRRVNLKPLTKRANRQLVKELLQNVPKIPGTLSDLILANAEGNPFYIEELVKVCVEAGVIVKSEPHWTVDELELSALDVPATLTGMLQARLERLPRAERTLIQQASVVGRVFWDQALSYLNSQGGDGLEEAGIQDGLSVLRAREMIYRRELSSFLNTNEFIFKHAVLREVSYESVLKELRRIYHARTAAWLKAQRGDRGGEVIGLIANHLQQAGERFEARHYLKWAGEVAAGNYANREAVEYFSQALALLPDYEQETRFELLLAREQVLDLQARREAQRQDLEALEALSNSSDSAPKQLEVSMRWSKYFWFVSDYQAAAEMAEQVVAQAKVLENLHYTALGQLNWGRALYRMDQFTAARQHLDEALVGFKTTGDQRRQGLTLRNLGVVAAGSGDIQAWREDSQEALKIARQIGDRYDEAEAINHLGNISYELGDFPSAKKHYLQYLEIAQEIGSRFQERRAYSFLGQACIAAEDYPAAQDYYRQALVIAQVIDNSRGEAMALRGLGRVQDGLELWEAATHSHLKAMDIFEELGDEFGIAYSRIGLARVALAQGYVEEALGFINPALDYLERSEGLLQGASESYLVCIKVLQAAGDRRAREVLETAYNKVQEAAEVIKDKRARRSFLMDVPWNRELVKLWEEQQ